MALRFYLVPKVGDGLSPDTAFAPKYVPALSVPWAAMDYGRESTMLIGADVSAAQHTALAANGDVTAIPADLDSLVGGAVATVQAALEALRLPAGWVTAGLTFRQVVGTVGRFFLLMQRFDGLHRRAFFEAGITLETRMNQLTAGQRSAFQDAAASLGLPTGNIAGNTTVRAVLKLWADSLGPIRLAGEVF